MNILVLGNGFDLAHDLPTSYNDFIEFCERTRRIYSYIGTVTVEEYEKNNLDNWKKHEFVKNVLVDAFKNRKIEEICTDANESRMNVTTSNKALDEMFIYIENNTWLNYFLKCAAYTGLTWIDFESEISKVVRALDCARKLFEIAQPITEISENEGKVAMGILKASQWNLHDVYKGTKELEKFTDFLYDELLKLIRALEIYISEIVGKMEVSKRSVDIDKIRPDHVLSFNYSDTFERMYGVDKNIEYDYIHGKADINNTVEKNNMVLGIDEYLDAERKDKDIEFIAFKKFYQRILKQTGCRYKEWVDDIREEYEKFKWQKEEAKEKSKMYVQDETHRLIQRLSTQEVINKKCEIHMLYFFGHSLDVTDKDVLKDLIVNDNVKTVIFYFERYDENGKGDNGRKDLGQKISNLVKVIGPEELIKRTGGSTKTIEFRLQKEMINVQRMD